MTLPWAAATATGIGSMPGTSAMESARIIAGELPAFLHVVELPARGPGADMVGRTMGLLHQVSIDLGVETTPGGWRMASGDGKTMRRAHSWLNEDLDALQETASETAGLVKLQVVGPWTLAASIELMSGERMLRDPGACRDLADGLGAAVALHIADVQRRIPGATVLVQCDEPALPAVMAGHIGTASGLSAYRAVDEPKALAALIVVMRAVKEAGAVAGVHCCGAHMPIDLIRRAGADFASLDLLVEQDQDEIGSAWEEGLGLLLGTVRAVSEDACSDTQAAAPILRIASRLGITDPALFAQVVVTPTCGLAGASPSWMRTALESCNAAARIVRDDLTDEERG